MVHELDAFNEQRHVSKTRTFCSHWVNNEKRSHSRKSSSRIIQKGFIMRYYFTELQNIFLMKVLLFAYIRLICNK